MKKTLKATVFALSFLLVFSLLGGCKRQDPFPIEDDPVVQEKPETPETPGRPETPTNPSTGLSDDIYSFTVMLDGKIYTFPTVFSEFAANGWEIQTSLGVDFSKESLAPKNYSSVVVVKRGDHQVYMTFINNSVDIKKIPDCDIGGIQLDDFDAKKGAELVFPGNVKIGSPERDVLSRYGEPSDKYESDNSKRLTYRLTSYAEVNISINKENGQVRELKMQNLLRSTTNKPSNPPATTGSAPSVITDYKPPTALGDSWNSFTVRYDNVLYKLPIPVSELMAHGWVPVTDENMIINAKGFATGFEIRLGNQTLRTSIRNYADAQQPVKYCFVTRIEYYDNGAKVSIELPKKLTEKSSIDDFIKAYGEPTKKSDSSSFNYYSWGKVFEELNVVVYKDTGVIAKIELDYDPKTLK